jgi:hypothetical protein
VAGVNLTISGLPAIIVQVGCIVVFSAPVWLAARMTNAEHPTLIRSALSLFLGVAGSIACIAIGGLKGFLLVPFAFLFSFKLVLGTSFLGSIVLAVIALAVYAAMVHFIGAGFFVHGAPPIST